MDERRAVVTGASGWVGKAFIAHFRTLYGQDWASKVALFGSSQYALDFEGAPLRVRSLNDLAPGDVEGADVFHLAFLTPEKVEQLGRDAFHATNARIDSLLVEAMSQARPRSVFVASSGAAAVVAGGAEYHEYGSAKLNQERGILDWGRRNDVSIFCGRIYNLAGPYLMKPDTYAIGSFICQALASGRIVVSAKVPVYRAYLHVMDLCRLATAAADADVVLEGPIDLSGPLVTEIQEVAEAVAAAMGLNPHDVERVAVDVSRPSAYLGDPTHLLTLAMRLGVRLAPFETQVRATVDYLTDQDKKAVALDGG